MIAVSAFGPRGDQSEVEGICRRSPAVSGERAAFMALATSLVLLGADHSQGTRILSAVWTKALQGRADAEDESERLGLGYEYNVMVGTPYAVRRRILRSPSGLPCTPPPFGALVAIDLRSGRRAWEVPLGSFGAAIPAAAGVEGATNLGGPIITAGGLVFIAATPDSRLRAFDIETGSEVWQDQLPAAGRATPMTYRGPRSGKQFVVIAAGGGGSFPRGEHIVAFSLP